jgi:1-acyl-sn-glycerol-3-phosphate acyltransferase
MCALPHPLFLKTYFAGFAEIFNHPLISWAVRFHRMIPLDVNLNLGRALKVCHYVLQKNKILVYFPEGQRSADGALKDFRKGIGILVKEARVNVLPMYIEGAYKAWPRKRTVPLPAKVTVRIGKCLNSKDLEAGEGQDPYAIIARNLRNEVSKLA